MRTLQCTGLTKYKMTDKLLIDRGECYHHAVNGYIRKYIIYKELVS